MNNCKKEFYFRKLLIYKPRLCENNMKKNSNGLSIMLHCTIIQYLCYTYPIIRINHDNVIYYVSPMYLYTFNQITYYIRYNATLADRERLVDRLEFTIAMVLKRFITVYH